MYLLQWVQVHLLTLQQRSAMQQGQRLLPVMPMQRPQPWKGGCLIDIGEMEQEEWVNDNVFVLAVLQVKRMSLV